MGCFGAVVLAVLEGGWAVVLVGGWGSSTTFRAAVLVEWARQDNWLGGSRK